jgi:uncharacterized protein YheU (UPF0270 family)
MEFDLESNRPPGSKAYFAEGTKVVTYRLGLEQTFYGDEAAVNQQVANFLEVLFKGTALIWEGLERTIKSFQGETERRKIHKGFVVRLEFEMSGFWQVFSGTLNPLPLP